MLRFSPAGNGVRVPLDFLRTGDQAGDVELSELSAVEL